MLLLGQDSVPPLQGAIVKTALIPDKGILVAHCLNRLSTGLTQFSYYNAENSEPLTT